MLGASSGSWSSRRQSTSAWSRVPITEPWNDPGGWPRTIRLLDDEARGSFSTFLGGQSILKTSISLTPPPRGMGHFWFRLHCFCNITKNAPGRRGSRA